MIMWNKRIFESVCPEKRQNVRLSPPTSTFRKTNNLTKEREDLFMETAMISNYVKDDEGKSLGLVVGARLADNNFNACAGSL